MPLHFADHSENPMPVTVLDPDGLAAWLGAQPVETANWAQANGFTGGIGQVLVFPDATGQPGAALIGYGTAAQRQRLRFTLAAAVPKLPKVACQIVSGLPPEDAGKEALGWLLSGYAFTRYRSRDAALASLCPPDGVDAAHIEICAQAEALTRDLVNTPTSDMGPAELEAAARDLATRFSADIAVTTGEDLLTANLPMIHAVGRASTSQPRLIDLRWGQTGPKLTLVGKGVCFDTGGLNLKPGSSMGLMKKDMGGAANVLGLAQAIMASGMPVQLRVLIPAVENSVAGNAFRPQDILTSRKGLTVEINNTDAEGRLVLADALALGDEETPDLMISMATLTGAARVAVGPDLAPFYTDDDPLALALCAAGQAQADPLWRMPFWPPYEEMIEPGIADLDNAPSGGFAGSITAALFLRRFVTDCPRYAHFDIYAWQPASAPGRSKGGLGQGPRAILGALPGVLGL